MFIFDKFESYIFLKKIKHDIMKKKRSSKEKKCEKISELQKEKKCSNVLVGG